MIFRLCMLFTLNHFHPIHLFLHRRLLAKHPVAKRSGHAADGQACPYRMLREEPDLLENYVRNMINWVLYPAQL